MPRIVKRLDVESDLLNLFLLIARGSVRAAHRFLDAVDKSFARLAAMPGLGSPIESDNPVLARLRISPVSGFKKYLILYRPLSDGIEVVRVLHGARDIESLFRSGP